MSAFRRMDAAALREARFAYIQGAAIQFLAIGGGNRGIGFAASFMVTKQSRATCRSFDRP